jgi:hypothetical protein
MAAASLGTDAAGVRRWWLVAIRPGFAGLNSPCTNVRLTDLGDGAPRCRHHHHLRHELCWHLERDPTLGIVNCYRPDGSLAGATHPRATPPPIPILGRRELLDRV